MCIYDSALCHCYMPTVTALTSSNRFNARIHTHFYTVSHKKSQLIFVCNFVKNQLILMQFSLLDLTMNDTHGGMNLTHLTQLVLLHYLAKVETVKM